MSQLGFKTSRLNVYADIEQCNWPFEEAREIKCTTRNQIHVESEVKLFYGDENLLINFLKIGTTRRCLTTCMEDAKI